MSRGVLLDNIHRLLAKDRLLVEKVIDKEFQNQPTRSMWDFADSLEKEVARHRKHFGENELETARLRVAERQKAIDELLHRFRKLNQAKEERISGQQETKSSRELVDCTFKPSLTKNAFYNDVKPRYKASQLKKSTPPPVPQDRPDERFDAGLRQYGRITRNPATEEPTVKLSDEVMKRLDEAADFYEVYREEMARLREYHSNLMKQEQAKISSS